MIIVLTGSFSDFLKNKNDTKAILVWEEIMAKRIAEKNLII
jgi:hypothetical protein